MSVTLDATTHTYKNRDGIKYISVTNFLSKYKKPFDKDKFSKQVAAREGVDPQVILDTWKQVTINAQNRGTDVHLLMENYIKQGIVSPGAELLVDSFNLLTKEIIKNKCELKSECILHLDEFKLAGTTDLIVENSKNFHIIDFKTNKKINFFSKYNEFFLPPIDYLQQCEFNTYALQLSMYAYMHEQATQKPCAGLNIFFLDNNVWTRIPCNYMKSTIESLLEDYENKYKQYEYSLNLLEEYK